VFAIAVAAGVSLSAVNLASEINKVQAARHSTVVKPSTPSAALPSETDTGGSVIQKTVLDPGA